MLTVFQRVAQQSIETSLKPATSLSELNAIGLPAPATAEAKPAEEEPPKKLSKKQKKANRKKAKEAAAAQVLQPLLNAEMFLVSTTSTEPSPSIQLNQLISHAIQQSMPILLIPLTNSSTPLK